MNPMWKVYKSKVLKTLNPEYEEDTAEEVHNLQLSPSLFLSLIHISVRKSTWLLALESKSHQVLFAGHFLFITGSDELAKLFYFPCKGNFNAEVSHFLLCILAILILPAALLSDKTEFVRGGMEIFCQFCSQRQR